MTTTDVARRVAEYVLRADAAEIRRIRVKAEPGGLDPVIHHRPLSSPQGKFSGECVAAAALLDGRSTDPAALFRGPASA
jgi:hypothetical protein